MEAMELQANIQIIPWNNNNGDTYNNNNYSYNNNDLNLHNNNNNNINFIGEEEPMEIDEDENTTELSNAIHKGDPFHYAKLHLHREIGNRDHKINELLLKLDDCRQQMQFVHNGGSLWQLQVMLAQQADVINAKSKECDNLFAHIHQQAEEYNKLQTQVSNDSHHVNEAILKIKQCQELWVQLLHQAEEYRLLEKETKGEARIGRKKDAIMKRLVDENQSLAYSLQAVDRRLRNVKEEQKATRQVFQEMMELEPHGYLKTGVEPHGVSINPFKGACMQKKDEINVNKLLSKEHDINPFKYEQSRTHNNLPWKIEKEKTSKVQHASNPFKMPKNAFKKEHCSEVQHSSSNPLNIKRSQISKRNHPYRHAKGKYSINNNNSNYNNSSTFKNTEANVKNDVKIPGRFQNLPSNVYLNPFKYPNASTVVNNKTQQLQQNQYQQHQQDQCLSVNNELIMLNSNNNKQERRKGPPPKDDETNSPKAWINRPAIDTDKWVKKGSTNGFNNNSRCLKRPAYVNELTTKKDDSNTKRIKITTKTENQEDFNNPFNTVGNKHGMVEGGRTNRIRIIKIKRNNGIYNRSNNQTKLGCQENTRAY